MTQETQQDITATQEATLSPEATSPTTQPANTDSATQADSEQQLKSEEISSPEDSPVAQANNQNNTEQNATTSADGPAIGELVEIPVPNFPLTTPPPSETPLVAHSETLHYINTNKSETTPEQEAPQAKENTASASPKQAQENVAEAGTMKEVEVELLKANTPPASPKQAQENTPEAGTVKEAVEPLKANTPPASPKRAQENTSEAGTVKEVEVEVELLKANTPPASPKQAQDNTPEAGTVKEEVEPLKANTPPASPKRAQDNTPEAGTVQEVEVEPEVADKTEPKPEEVASPSKSIGVARKILSLNESVREALSKRGIKIETLKKPEDLDSEILKSIIAEMNFGDGSQTARTRHVNNSIQALIDEAKPKPPVDVEEPKAENTDNINPKIENEPTQPSQLPNATSQPEQTDASETPSQKEDEPTSIENADNKPAPLEIVEGSTSTIANSPKAETENTPTPADTSDKKPEENAGTPILICGTPFLPAPISLSNDLKKSLQGYIDFKKQNKKTLHRKDFFGFRSDEIEKLHIASKVSTKVFSKGFTSKVELFKFLGEQLRANTKQTGHQFASGALACILENAKNEVLAQMNPLEKARAELEDYIQKAAETQQGKRARYGFRSDQTAKLAQADLVNTLFKNRDNSVSLTDAEKQTIEKAIQANLAATTFTPGKGKGQLNSILTSLLEAGSKVVTTQTKNVGP